jgi:hypothetical protein
LSSSGNFSINDTIVLPTTCDRPILLIRIGAPDAAGPFIAVAAPFFERDNGGPGDED